MLWRLRPERRPLLLLVLLGLLFSFESTESSSELLLRLREWRLDDMMTADGFLDSWLLASSSPPRRSLSLPREQQ